MSPTICKEPSKKGSPFLDCGRCSSIHRIASCTDLCPHISSNSHLQDRLITMVALNDPVFVTARILAPCVSVLFVLVNQGKQHWLYLDMMDVRYNLPISDDHQTINAGYSTRSSPHIDWHTLNDTNMSYAPYQDESNEPDAPLERDPTARQQTPYADDVTQGINVQSGAGFGNGLGADERNPDPFSTSLPMRLEIEASLAYLGLPPAGGAILLMMEHKNDYVRYVEQEACDKRWLC